AAPVVVHRVSEEEQHGLVLLDLRHVVPVIEDGAEVLMVAVQVPDDDELPLLARRELDEPSGPAVRSRRAQCRVEREDVFHGASQQLQMVSATCTGPRHRAFSRHDLRRESPWWCGRAGVSTGCVSPPAMLWENPLTNSETKY